MSVRPRAFAAAPACLTLWSAALFGSVLFGPGPARAVTVGSKIYVSPTGSDANTGADLAHAKKTIQAGVSAVAVGGTVYLEPGTYTGLGNTNISFGSDPNNQHDLVVRSDPANGGTPANTIINLQGAGQPAFELGGGLTSAAGLMGLTIENSTDAGPGGAVSIALGSPTIQNCVFFNNHGSLGGAIILADSSSVIRECTFTQNQAVPSAFSTGGAIEIETTNELTSGTFTPLVTNCVFSQNSAQTDGAAIDVSNGLQPLILNAAITNCTFTGNTSAFTDANDPGGAVGVYSANVTVTNSILYGDTVGSGAGSGEITIVPANGAPNAAVTAKSSDIQQASGVYPGTANFNANPLFAANLDLATGSPAINAGTTSVPAGADITIDRTGRARDPQPDLGAYEVLAPTANAQSVAVPFNTAKSITLVGTDPNVTPRPLTYIVTSPPAHGTLSGTAPNLTYTPSAGYHGSDAFTFKVNNGTYDSAQVMVTLTVAAGVPTANNQTVAVPFNTATAVTLTGSDPDSPPLALTYTVTSTPGHGMLSGTTPNLTYTPSAGYHGPDVFTFQVNNGVNTSSTATVTLNVATGIPTANPQSVTTNQDTAVGITLTGSDPDSPPLPLTYAITTNPAHGTLSGFNAGTGAVTYTPNAGFFGADSFQFKASNGTSTSSAATVSITVVGKPTANPQSVAVAFNTAKAVTLTGSDPNSPPRSLAYTVTTNPAHGTLSGTAPNLTYTPTVGYHGSDSFQFTVSNGTLTSAPATVTLTVATGVPTANPQSVTTNQDTAVGITLTGSDPDVPPLPLTFAVTTNPAHGTLSGTAPNLTYTPIAGYFGPDTLQFTVSNGVNTSAPATVSLTVTQVAPATVGSAVGVAWGTAGTATLTTAADGLRLLPSGRTTDLPWLGVSRLTLTLSRAVALSAADVSVTGVNIASYGPVTVSGAGTSYTVTLAQPISAADRVTLTVGNANLATYTRRLDVLPGDVTDDGTVTSTDAVQVRNMYLGVGGTTPSVFGDINGDGVVDVNDYNAVRARLGTHLP